jgi:uncharacterized protein involved in exopolysaccharide biosynthesis
MAERHVSPQDEAAGRDGKTFHDLADVFRRRKKEIFLPALAVFALAAIVAFALPRTYKSTATLLVEGQEVPPEYAAANIASFADRRLQSIKQRIMSTTKLLDLIARFGLYADMKEKVPADEIVAKMRKAIRFDTISADVVDPRTGLPPKAAIAFGVSYEGSDPETVRRVANELASLCLEENRKAMDAKAGQGLGMEQLADRFSVIDPARLPEKPSSPNIPAIFLIGLVLGMGSGVILAAVRESGDDTVRSPRDLGKIARGLPVLASVPVIVTAADDGLRKRRTMKFAAATALVFAAGVLIFHFYVFHLDAAWAMVVRKLSA